MSILWHCLSLGLPFFGIGMKKDLQVLWPLLTFPNLLAYGVQHFHSIIQHSPVSGCSAVSCNFGVLPREDECMSFYSAILNQSSFPTLLQPAPEAVFLVQLLSHVQLFVTPGTAAPHSSLSFTISQNLLKLMSNHFILCLPFSFCPQSFPASGSFPVSQLSASGG